MILYCNVSPFYNPIENGDLVVFLPLKENTTKEPISPPQIKHIEVGSFYSMGGFPVKGVYKDFEIIGENKTISLLDSLGMVVDKKAYDILSTEERLNPGLRNRVESCFETFRQYETMMREQYGDFEPYHSILNGPFKELFSSEEMAPFKNIILSKEKPTELLETYIGLNYFLFNLNKLGRILLPSMPKEKEPLLLSKLSKLSKIKKTLDSNL